MNIRIGFAVAAAVFVVPLSAGAAGAATTPDWGRPGPVPGTVVSDTYNPACEAGYRAGRPALDPLIQMGPSYAGTVELALCGDNRHD